jgi:hypothetical protein
VARALGDDTIDPTERRERERVVMNGEVRERIRLSCYADAGIQVLPTPRAVRRFVARIASGAPDLP